MYIRSFQYSILGVGCWTRYVSRKKFLCLSNIDDNTDIHHSKPKITIEEISRISQSSIDCFKLVDKDLSTISANIRELLGSDNPILEQCAKYFFNIDGGKKIRPVMVLGISYALSAQRGSNMGATPSDRRIAEITEMIHTASLFHDDVIDKATTRRNIPSVNQVFGDKVAILGGDFLLSRATISLARLRNVKVVELLSSVIEHLVKGEVMQMRNAGSSMNDALVYYLKKNFYKTASLMGHSCLAPAVLGKVSSLRYVATSHICLLSI